MADDLESIGGLSVTISGDYSKLMSDLQTSQALAATAGTEIADSLEAGASGAAMLTEAAGDLSTKLEQTGAASTEAAEGQERMGAALKESTVEVSEAESNVGALTEKLGELALELTAGLTILEFGKQMFEAAGQIQAADISLTALTGSADTARESIDRLKAMAVEQGLSFPDLLQANQRMVALGFSSDVSKVALQAAADAAAATNSDIGTLSDTIDRLALSGQVSARFLATLGISTHELAEAMGVADDQVVATFHSLDTTTRLHVLTMAIEDVKHFAGLSQETAETIPRQWQSLKSTFEDFAASVGDEFSYVGGQLLTWFKNRVEDAQLLVNVLATAGEEIEYYATRAGNVLSELTTRVFQGAEAAKALAAEHAASLQKMVAGFADAEAKRLHLNEGVETTTKSLAELQKEFNADIATKNWTEANAVIAEMGKVSVPAAEAAMRQLIAAQQGNVTLLDGLVKGVRQARGELAFWIDEEKLEVAQQETVTKAIAAYGETHVRAGDNISYAAAKQGYFAEQTELAADKIAKELEKAPELTRGFEALGLGTEKAGKAQQTFQSIMESAGIEIDKALPPLSAFQQQIAKIDAQLQAGGAVFPLIGAIQRLADTSLPDAVAKSDQLVQKTDALTMSAEEYNRVIEQNIKLHEDLATQQGKSITGYQVQLQLVTLQTQLLGYDSQHVFGTTIAGGLRALDRDLGQVGQQIARTALETHNWGQLAHTMLIQLAGDLLSTVFNSLVKMGEQFVVEKATERATGSATNVAAVTSEAAVAAANAFASTAAIPIVGPALAPAAAAEAEGFVMGLAPQAAFEAGGYVPETMLALVHKGEYVVPAKDVQAAGGGQGSLAPGGLSIVIGNLHGVTRDTADHLAELIFRKARLAGAFR